ncbi:MAG: hypothetical protein V3U24_05240 [Candidatus Neomarinimicrobiota bacterium]
MARDKNELLFESSRRAGGRSSIHSPGHDQIRRNYFSAELLHRILRFCSGFLTNKKSAGRIRGPDDHTMKIVGHSHLK